MKKLLAALVFLFIPIQVYSADLSTTTCPGAGCTDINVVTDSSLGIQITGTWVGTITFRASVDGVNFVSTTVVSVADTAAVKVTTTTANGLFATSVSGFRTVRVVFTAYTSGTAVVTPRSSRLANSKSGGAGNSSSGSPGGSDTQVQFNDAGVFGGNAGLTYNKTTERTILRVNSPFALQLGTEPTSGHFYLGTTNAASPDLIFSNNAGTETARLTTASALSTTSMLATQIFASDIFQGAAASTINGPQTATNTQTYKVYDTNAAAYRNWLVTTANDAPNVTISIPTDGTLNLTTTLHTTAGSGLTVANVGANSCGTTAATIAGNMNKFEITIGAVSGTQCRITFPTASPTRWGCIANNETTANLARATPVNTTTVDFLGTFAGGDVVSGICFPR